MIHIGENCSSAFVYYLCSMIDNDINTLLKVFVFHVNMGYFGSVLFVAQINNSFAHVCDI